MVAGIWASSILMDMFNPAYQPDPAINAIFGGTIGTALTLGRKDNDRNDRGGRRK